MKLIQNKLRCFLPILILTTCLAVRSQENQKMKVKSFSFANGIHGSASPLYDGGLHLGVDLATEFKDNIFSVNFGLGGEVSIFGTAGWYHELNLTFGREVFLKPWFAMEGHIGLGYINYVDRIYGNEEFVRIGKKVVGVPIRLKVLFYTGKHFGLGINANMNLNSHATLYSGGILIQYAIN